MGEKVKKRKKEKAAKIEKAMKEKVKKEKNAKEKSKKAERAKKEAHEKYKAAARVLEKISADCSQKAKHLMKHTIQQDKDSQLVKIATKKKIKVCTAQKKAKEIAAKAKEKLAKKRNIKITGPTFKFGKNPCKKGFGKFTQKLVLNRVNVGLIPAGQV